VTGLPDTRNCPDAELLGCFISGKLEAGERRTVSQHVATCDQCLSIIGETSRFLAEEHEESEGDADVPPQISRWRWKQLATAAALACVFAGGAAYQFTHRDPLSGLRAAVRTRPRRPVEGRLADFPYAAYGETLSGRATAVDDAVTAEAREVERMAGNDAGTHHARGVAAAVRGDAKTAVAELEAATHADANNAAYWSDLAAAWIAAGRTRDDAQPWQEAITAAGHAIEHDPSSAEGVFNRAVAAEHLGDLPTARAAYERYRQLDSGSPWAEEARRRLAHLQR
jgi:tetratricopeptide (TPR) repeat protein